MKDFFIHESYQEYARKRGEYLTSHALIDFIRCPLLYQKKRDGLIVETCNSSAFILGRAAHTLILEGRDKFNSEYIVGGPINERTGKEYGADTKAFSEWRKQQTKDVLSLDQADLVERLHRAVCENENAYDIISEPDSITEGVIRNTFNGVKCQIRTDYFSERFGVVDLKTCEDLDNFKWDFKRYHYANQVAFYREIIHVETNQYYNAYIIAVEKSEPFRCGIFRVSDCTLEIAQRENISNIEQLKNSMETGVYTTRYEEILDI